MPLHQQQDQNTNAMQWPHIAVIALLTDVV